MNHPVTANCLRKCTYWSLSIVDNQNKSTQQCFRVNKNSGIALHQMNYEVLKGLSAEQLKEKKESLQIPNKLYPFENDIIDEMTEFENQSVFNAHVFDYHTKDCKFKNGRPQCCEPLIKNFNKYNQKSYTDQSIELPFELGKNGDTTSTIDNLDLVSQLSSQLSDSSKGFNAQTDVRKEPKYKDLLL